MHLLHLRIVMAKYSDFHKWKRVITYWFIIMASQYFEFLSSFINSAVKRGPMFYLKLWIYGFIITRNYLISRIWKNPVYYTLMELSIGRLMGFNSLSPFDLFNIARRPFRRPNTSCNRYNWLFDKGEPPPNT